MIYAGVLSAALVWGSLILLAPWLWDQGQTVPAALLYRAFAGVCHQIPERSFTLWGKPLGVCSRCTGVYFGFAAGVMIYPLIRRIDETSFPARSILIAAAIPIAVDFALGFLGVWANTFGSRTMTGLLFGVVVAFFITPGFMATFSDSAKPMTPLDF